MFKTFPEFSKLTLADRAEYEAPVKDYPPIDDISFTSLMTWWSSLTPASVALLNGNLVISYYIPGDERHTGLSLVGMKDIDESICAIFDYLRDKGEPLRLVNVPEFVLSNAAYPAMFHFKEQRALHEYILPLSGFYPISNMTGYRRRKVERQLNKAKDLHVVTRSLDLGQLKNRKFLWNVVVQWQPKGINDYGKVEQDAIKTCIDNAETLGLENVCLFIDNELYGFCLYRIGPDKRYATIKHIKATHVSTLGFELIAYMFAQWFSERGVVYANVCSDFGLLRLRMFMLTLGPYNFFRKYSIEPA